jgi:hypothetical protein
MILTDASVGPSNITTQNLLTPTTGLATGATANSSVYIDTRGSSTVSIQVTGTYTGVLTAQGTLDGTNWVALSGTGLLNINTGAYSATVASAATGMFQADVSGFAQFRLTANAAVTGTAVVTLRATSTAAMFALDNALPTGTNSIGTVQLGNTANTTPILANPGTPTVFNLTAAATTNATSVKATAGTLYSIVLTNYSAAPKFFKLYNKASAPTVGTDIPLETFEVAANASRAIDFGPLGLRYSTGIAYAMTGAQADADTTALAAGDLKVHGSYI